MAANKYSQPAERDHAKVAKEKLRVSFEFLDLELPHFFFHGLDAEHYRKIFDCINSVADATEDQIVQQTHPSLEAKSIFNTSRGTYRRFPERVEENVALKIAGAGRRVDPLDKASVKAAQDEHALAIARAKTDAKRIVNTAFEISVGRAWGRIHGFVWDKTFYAVWFDPAHNLYPTKTNGIRLHREYATVKGFGPDEVAEVVAANRQLTDDNAELQRECGRLEVENHELMEAFAAK